MDIKKQHIQRNMYRYVNSAFSSLAKQIVIKLSAKQRKLACLIQVVSNYTKSDTAECYASTTTLLIRYNELCSRYSLAPIQVRSLQTLIALAASSNLLNKRNRYVISTNQTLRYLTININSLKTAFSAVYNLAFSHAEKLFNRQNLHLGRSSVDNSDKASDTNGFKPPAKTENCRVRTKIISKDIIHINDKSVGIRFLKPLGNFFKNRFGDDAEVAKSLQDAARTKKLTASGAKLLITLHKKHSVKLASTFKSYLDALICADRYAAMSWSEFREKYLV